MSQTMPGGMAHAAVGVRRPVASMTHDDKSGIIGALVSSTSMTRVVDAQLPLPSSALTVTL